jgi:hypothetical protein
MSTEYLPSFKSSYDFNFCSLLFVYFLIIQHTILGIAPRQIGVTSDKPKHNISFKSDVSIFWSMSGLFDHFSTLASVQTFVLQ